MMKVGKSGGRTRARTWDPLIKSQLLYQLSYTSIREGRRHRGRPRHLQPLRKEAAPRLGSEARREARVRIEDETLALLKELESDVAQGWPIGKPMPASALEALLGDGRRLAA